MSSKLNTKDIKTGGGGLPKLLQPGNIMCKINGVELEAFKFKPGGYHMILHLEGPDLGKEFEGFFIDKADESKGRHKGQVGQVKAGEWAFADGETKGGTVISRDAEILKFLKNLCTAFGVNEWLVAQNDKHDTIESLVAAFNKENPTGNKLIDFCICGKEYQSKGGYTNYELFLPKFVKGSAPFGTKNVIKFNEAEHIRKKKVEPVSEFGEATDASTELSGPATEDFKLD